MIPVSPLAFPGPKTIAEWWSRFAPTPSTAILVGWFEIVRVELLVQTVGSRPLDPLARAVLRAVEIADPPTLAGIAERTHLGDVRAMALVRTLAEVGALELRESGSQTHVALTDLGRQILRTGEVPTAVRTRRAIALRNGECLSVPESWGFKPIGLPGPVAAAAVSDEALRRAVASAFNPPVRLADNLPTADRWRAVRIERSEWWPLVVVGLADGADVYLANAADWSLPNDRTFAISAEPARDAVPELIAAPSAADLDKAWIQWANSRAATHDELQNCRTAFSGQHLEVSTPPALFDWLQANRAHVFAGDTTILIGEGVVRRVGILRVGSACEEARGD